MSLYGKVLKLFDETSVLVNLGKTDGLKRGDKLVIVEEGEEITDLESGESLGHLELVKAELTAVDVQERMSVLKTEPGKDSAEGMPLSSRMVRDSVGGSAGWAKMTVTSGELSGIPSTSPVKKGDIVRVVE
jgi:hypothetical protein